MRIIARKLQLSVDERIMICKALDLMLVNYDDEYEFKHPYADEICAIQRKLSPMKGGKNGKAPARKNRNRK